MQQSKIEVMARGRRSMEIREFQDTIKELYLHNDRRRGKDKTMLWLVEEVGELAEAVRREDEAGVREEIADTFAWVGSLANLYGIDLEEAFLKKYPYKCPTCGQMPCICKD